MYVIDEAMIGCKNLNKDYFENVNIIRIYNNCDVGIEKSTPRIAIRHNKACQMIIYSNFERQIYQSHLHTNDGSFC